MTENHDCSMYANCDNDVGYYKCTCNDGFSGDGFGVLGCSDLDECQSNPCLATEYCVNTMGSHRILNTEICFATLPHVFWGKTCFNESVIVSYAYALLVMLK